MAIWKEGSYLEGRWSHGRHMRMFDTLALLIRRTLAQNMPDNTHHQSAPECHDLMDNLQQVIFQINPIELWTFLSSGWSKLTGFSVEESIGKSYLKYIHPKDHGNCRKYFDVVSNNIANHGSIVVRCLIDKDDFRWVEVHANPLLNRGDCIIGVVGTITDVTNQVQERERLLADHRTLTSLIDDLPGMVYRGRNNRDWTMEYVSAGSFELIGYHSDELINNKALAYGSLIHPKDQERVWNEVQCALRENRRFEIVYRIRTADGNEKWVWERGVGIFSTTGELLGLEGFITDITQKKKDESRLKHELLYDITTGLRTPHIFIDHLQHAVEKARTHRDYAFALLIVHVDRIPKILSKFGPELIDQLIVEVSQRLKDVISFSDILSRLKDDQFGVLLDETRDIKEVTNVARRIQEQLFSPIQIKDSEVYITTSIGIALSEGKYERSEQMLRDAETALERAKELGGARYEVSNLHIHTQVAALSQMEGDLQRALEQHALRIYWQPVVSCQSGRISGLEARLAWLHSRHGILFAEQWVSVAETIQLIVPLWEWMFSEVCRQMKSWQSLPWTKHISINIQVFGRTLLDTDLILRLGEHVLAERPQAFSLALGTSGDVLNQTCHAVKEVIKQLKAKNIRLTLDSFGDNSSSLAILRNIPIDMIRLDRSLVADSDKDPNFIGAIVSFAHALGIEVIAGGIETEQQLSTMRKLGCDYIQGDFISPPVDEKAVITMLEPMLRSESGSW